MPSAVARAHASARAAIAVPASRLLQSFSVCPAPCPPTCTVRPRQARSGRCCSKIVADPPTMIVSSPASAPRGPPLTGASSTSTPCGSSAAASRRARAGELVDISISAVPGRAASTRPSAPSTTSSTASTLGSEVTATSAAAKASAGVAATRAPRAAAREESRSHATTAWPAARSRRPIGRPIVPTPTSATRVTRGSRSGGELAAELGQAGLRPAGRGQRDPDDDLVRARRVGDAHLERQVVRAHGVVRRVLEREVERRTRGTALLGRGQERCAADRVANAVAEAEVVQDRRAVLHLAVEADERSLAVGLGVAAERGERACDEQAAEGLAVGVDERREILDETAGERVLDHRRGGGDHEWRLDRPASVGVYLLDDRDELADPVQRRSGADARELRDDLAPVHAKHVVLAVRHQIQVELVDADSLELAQLPRASLHIADHAEAVADLV